MANINMIRIATRLKEIMNNKIDMSDFPNDQGNHFETRAIAALALMMKSGIDVEKACSCITDGYHDMGIDALYLDNSQKKLFVVQSKWRKEGKGSISQEEMQGFIEGVDRILNDDLNGANEKIIAKKPDIDFAITEIGYQIQLLYVHSGNNCITEYAKRPLDKIMQMTNDEVSTLLLFEEITYKEIYLYLSEGQKADNIVLNDVILSNWGKIDTPVVAYYGIVSASIIGEWYQEYGNLLFDKNIRYYKGNTDVNEGMQRVLKREPENFFYYNNGVKILCSKVERKAKNSTNNHTGLFSLTGVSVVNGAQTTGTIGLMHKSDPEHVAKASVMLQIIDLSSATENMALQITKLSNTQNRIENKDFAALDPQQDRIRAELAFSHISYLYKTGDSITDPDHQITFDEAIVAMACGVGEISYATLAKSNVGALSEDIGKTPYKALFNASN